MSVASPILLGWLIVALAMVGLFLWQLKSRDAGIVDVGWAGGVAALALLYGFWLEGAEWRRALVAAMGAIWGGRLAIYLFVNRVWKPGEDGRYAAMRQYFGHRAQPFFFAFFQMQAIWAVMFSIPFLVVMRTPDMSFRLWDALGVAIWALSIGGEALADWQLARFRARPETKGKTCRDGLWRYSRHPNYFFEWLHWWAYCAMAVGAPLGWVALFGPVVMGLFLFRVTGIPYTERQALKSRGDDYRDYQRTTSVFIPWLPKGETK